MSNTQKRHIQIHQHTEATIEKLPHKTRLLCKNGWVDYYPDFLSEKLAENYMETLCAVNNHNWKQIDWRTNEGEDLKAIDFAHINWQHNQIKLFGKTIYEPRFSAWYGDNHASYTYSGVERRPVAWTPLLQKIKQDIEQIVSRTFNSVLLNWYRDGQDSMGWHADDEKELGNNPLIASLSLGANRDFQLHRKTDTKQKVTISIQNGSLLVMGGSLQHHWKHALPKRKNIQKPRINLTFRTISLSQREKLPKNTEMK